MQINLEIIDGSEAGHFRTVTVSMDRIPEVGDQIVLSDAQGAIAYRVLRQSWRIEVRRDIYGEVVAHTVQLEPAVEKPAAAPRTRRTKSAA